ncbi:hypothetical protein GPA_21310 [Gordonibacter pamelaeae 7-10-1-b]|uniref:Uncharacterized protein n=1 Tax=Gordonibacter pamelaeae 7-10-1-b TaxID=657308 RepID=D6E9P0_9ACTN|nr:hypothetical protein GPA_21310 [Gordonibacter pamelaeae 7-10-1-b]
MGVRGLWSEDLPYWRRVWRNILNLLPCSIVGEFFAVPLMRGSIRFGTVYWKALRALTVLLAHTNYPLIRFACLKARNLIRKDTPGGGASQRKLCTAIILFLA